MKADAILIETPEKQSLPRRILYGATTIVAWVAWCLLWLPALQVLVRRLDLPARYARWIPNRVLHGASELEDIVWIAPLCLALFVAWSYYVGRRRSERRRAATRVPLAATAESLGASTAEAERIQDSRRVVLRVDDEGQIGVSGRGNPPLSDTDSSERARKTG